eukprot:2009996-Pyramimonas_sp.AAC.1
MASETANMAPSSPKVVHICIQVRPRNFQNGKKNGQIISRRLPRWLKRPPTGPKRPKPLMFLYPKGAIITPLG